MNMREEIEVQLAEIRLGQLRKRELLLALEHVPQHFWPQHPTHQNVLTLRGALRRAIRVSPELRKALEELVWEAL